MNSSDAEPSPWDGKRKIEDKDEQDAKPQRNKQARSSSLDKNNQSESNGEQRRIFSLPPTDKELCSYKDVPAESLPKKYKREQHDRIFANRNLSLDKIEWIGFDLDYTLAVYCTPTFEAMTYKLLVQALVGMGYPKTIESFEFDRNFGIRGLFLDTKYGNLLKLDAFSNILAAVHGHHRISDAEMKEFYPSHFVPTDLIGVRKRYQPLNTLFDIPKTAIVADLVDFLDTNSFFKPTVCRTGVETEGCTLTYRNMVADIEASLNIIHDNGILKTTTMQDLAKYVHKDPRLVTLLQRLRASGKRPFLTTNSGYEYSNAILEHLFEGSGVTWQAMFDVKIVDACKPLFFGEGTSLREVNQSTGSLMLGTVTAKLDQAKIYSGGSSDMFCQLTGAKPHSILYVGDHIYGDILKSKKKEGWHTFLVVPELAQEINKWDMQRDTYTHLQNLEYIMAETYRDMASDCHERPETQQLVRHISAASDTLDMTSNKYFGSLFRSGSSMSFFSMQTQRYADLYAPTCLNLLNYPFFYNFRAEPQRMPHECL